MKKITISGIAALVTTLAICLGLAVIPSRRVHSQTFGQTVLQSSGANLHVDCDSGCSGGGGTQDVNVAEWDGTALGSPSAYGTAPSGDVNGVNAYITNTVPVSGTFWQTTQPVSGTVSVSNFPATQPVSGSVSVSNFPSAYPVTGTFWQTTQPVSLDKVSSYSTGFSVAKTSLTTGVTIILLGSSSKTIHVTSWSISGTATSLSQGNVFAGILTGVSGGTCTDAATTPDDSNNSAATATLEYCSASPATTGGFQTSDYFTFESSTQALSAADRVIHTFGNGESQYPTLRGTSQGYGFYLTIDPAGAVVFFTLSWTEQ